MTHCRRSCVTQSILTSEPNPRDLKLKKGKTCRKFCHSIVKYVMKFANRYESFSTFLRALSCKKNTTPFSERNCCDKCGLKELSLSKKIFDRLFNDLNPPGKRTSLTLFNVYKTLGPITKRLVSTGNVNIVHAAIISRLQPLVEMASKSMSVKCFLSTFRNEGIEIRRFLYKDVTVPTVGQLKEKVKELYRQLRGEQFELMYLGLIRVRLSVDRNFD